MSSKIDLVTLGEVKAWLKIKDEHNTDDGVLQFLITAFSDYALWRCGVDSFNSVNQYVEVYDGNGSVRMFLRNTPIVTINSVIAGGNTIPLSTGLTTPGYFIERSRKSIAFRSSGSRNPASYGRIFHYVFPEGIGNIQVDYTAGYEVVPPSLVEATMKAVAINYKRGEWIDLASKSLSTPQGGTGTTRYRDWSLPPEVRDVLSYYSRQALV